MAYINNEKYCEIDKSLFQYLKDVNGKYIDFVAIDFLGRKFKFSEFIAKVEEVKKALIASNLKEGDVISVLYLTTPETIFLYYAANELGITINFLNPIEPDSIKETIIDENPAFVLCFDQFYPFIKGFVPDEKIVFANPTDSFPYGIQLIDKIKNLIKNKAMIKLPKNAIKWKDFIANGIKLPLTSKNGEALLGTHLGTGGSSGIPKQVNLSNALLNNIVKQHYLMNNSKAFNLSIDRGDTLLDVIPPHLGYGVCDIHLALSFGLTLAIAPNPNPKEFVKSIFKYKPNFILAGPVHWKEYNKYTGKKKTPYIKIAVSGGEKLEKSDEDSTNHNLEKRGSNTTVREGVGLTEVAGVATYNSSLEISKYTVGRPLPEYQVGIFKADLEDESYDNTKLSDVIGKLYYLKLLDGEFEITSEGNLGIKSVGEICYCLPIKIDGYVGRYMSENEVLIKTHEDGKQWIHTGDVGYIREDHNLVIVDRIKRVFNRNGFKVYPNAIENKATECPFIQDCVVIPRFSVDVGEANVPVMYVVLKGEYKDKIEEVIEYCKQNITGVSSIYDFIFLDEMPRTSAGKKAFKYIQTIDAIHYPAAGSESYEVGYSKIKKITLKQMKEIEAHE